MQHVIDKRKTGEGAMSGWKTRRVRLVKEAEMKAALRAWVEMQSADNSLRLYNAAIAYFGIKPVIPD